jgi:hypothetical protein
MNPSTSVKSGRSRIDSGYVYAGLSLPCIVQTWSPRCGVCQNLITNTEERSEIYAVDGKQSHEDQVTGRLDLGNAEPHPSTNFAPGRVSGLPIVWSATWHRDLSPRFSNAASHPSVAVRWYIRHFHVVVPLLEPSPIYSYPSESSEKAMDNVAKIVSTMVY